MSLFVKRHGRRGAIPLMLLAVVLTAFMLPRTATAVLGGATVLDFAGSGGGIVHSGFVTVLQGTKSPEVDKLALADNGSGLTVTATSGSIDSNNQDNALGVLFDGRAAYSVITRMTGPFIGTSRNGSAGIYLGLDAKNNMRLTLNQSSGTGKLTFVVKDEGTKETEQSITISTIELASADTIDLMLTASPDANTLIAQYRLNGENKTQWRTVKQITLPPDYEISSLYAGILSTTAGANATAFQTVYNWFKVVEPVQGDNAVDPAIGFTSTTIFDRDRDITLDRPTTLTFGPDGKLYVGTQLGLIFALTLDANKRVVNERVISTIHDIPNTNDDGTASTVVGRLVLGLTFDPASSPEHPVMYITHSDARVAKDHKRINTRSATVSRLTGPDYDASSRVDLITGLPRSRDNHAINGLSWGPDGWLYIALAGNTNFGAPSAYFTNLSEAYLSSSILRANIKSPDFGTRDVSQVTQASDLTPLAGLFEIYATGLRNPYDLTWHSNGKLYVNINGGNDGFGLTPDSTNGCPNGAAINPGDVLDVLVTLKKGDFAGHPNPARGQCIYGDGSLYTPAKPKPANYVDPVKRYGHGSFDGIVEYPSNVFNGAMRGNLLTVDYGYSHSLRRVVLSADGTQAVKMETLDSSFKAPLDVTATSDGTIFVADHGADSVVVLQPTSNTTCPLVGDPAKIDSDSDGYTDEDEADAKSNSCSASSTPSDFDNDHVSDIHDPDDDNDGIADSDDQFPYDPANGTQTKLPVALEWNPGDAPLSGYQRTGFTGVQLTSNGTRELPGQVSVGVAGGYMGINSTAGTNSGSNNNQSNALQIGFDATHPFTITTRLPDPFISHAPTGDQSAGLFFGLDQDNYVKLVVGADSNDHASGVQFEMETGGTLVHNPSGQNVSMALPGPEGVELFLQGDPGTGIVSASYRVDSDDPAQIKPIGSLKTSDYPALAPFFRKGAAAGLLTTNAGSKSAMNFGFDYFRINGAENTSSPDGQPPQVIAQQPAPGATDVPVTTMVTAQFDEPVAGVNQSTFTLIPHDGGTPVAATVSYDATTNTATLDPVDELHPDMVYDVVLTEGIVDNADMPLQPVRWSFTTRSASVARTYQLFLPMVLSE